MKSREAWADFVRKRSKLGKRIEGLRRDLLPDPVDYYAAELKRLGRRSRDGWASALCPFHDDASPSFSVNLKHGGFHCFSCSVAGGDVISFQMQRYNQSFTEAAKALGAWGEDR